MLKKVNVTILLAALCLTTAWGQPASSAGDATPIDYKSYMHAVGERNKGYASEKLNIDIRQAEILSAGVFPDPELELAWFDNGERRQQMGYGFGTELSWTLELGGKRSKRLDFAHSQADLSQVLLEEYFHNLRAEATYAYLEAIEKKTLLDLYISSYHQMRELAKSDSLRYELGSISELDAKQSKLEANSLLNEVYAAESEWKAAVVTLNKYMGADPGTYYAEPTGSLEGMERNFSLEQLLELAGQERMELKVAIQDKRVSASELEMIRASYKMDLGLSVEVEHNTYAHNEIAPTPAFTSVKAGVSIPLKFSNRRKGELKAAQYTFEQSELNYQQAILALNNEVSQAFIHYEAQRKQVNQYKSGMLTEANEVLEKKVYGYRRGEVSLMDVLLAQRTHNELKENYFQTLFNQAVALIELERSVGMWDIEIAE